VSETSCPSCGATLMDEVPVCPVCGRRMGAVAAGGHESPAGNATGPTSLQATDDRPRLAGRVLLLALDVALLGTALLLGAWLIARRPQPVSPSTTPPSTPIASFTVPLATATPVRHATPTATRGGGPGGAPPPTPTPRPTPRPTATPTATPTPQQNH
jgi:hypothetical protein